MKRNNSIFIVYVITNKVNGKQYVGITSTDIKSRIQHHISEAYNKNSINYNNPFKRAIRKYGMDNFEIEIKYENLTCEEAQKLEITTIKELNTYILNENSNGYNATFGGDISYGNSKDRVVQVDVDTYTVKNIFTSCQEAMKKLNISHIIYDICSKRLNYSKQTNSTFYYEKEYKKMSKDDIIKDIDIRLNKLYKLDNNKNIIEKFKKTEDAVLSMGCGTTSNINAVVTGKRASCNRL